MAELLIQAENFLLRPPGGEPLAKIPSLQLSAGEILWITGENGTGKTTLLHQLCEAPLPAAAAQTLTCAVPRAQRAFVPQTQNKSFHLPCTLDEVLRVSSQGRFAQPPLWQDVIELGLLAAHHQDLEWNTASGGERQRTLLARALLSRPQLLFLDEPFNHLDRPAQKQVARALVDFLRRHPTAAIALVSHSDPAEELLEVPLVPLELRGLDG